MRPSLSPSSWFWLARLAPPPVAPDPAASALDRRIQRLASVARAELLDLLRGADEEVVDGTLSHTRAAYDVGDEARMYGAIDVLIGGGRAEPQFRAHVWALTRQHVVLQDLLDGDRGAHRRTQQGRRAVANGDRPPIVEAIAAVLGTDVRTIPEVIEGLESRGWLPNSRSPRSYIAQVLASRSDRFERVRRGVYQARRITGPEPQRPRCN